MIPLIVISLTTIPERIENTRKIIQSELSELSGNYVIVLNLPLKYNKFDIDSKFKTEVQKLEKIQNKHFILNRCQDYGPLTKLLPTLSLNFPRETILIVRDDNCYHNEAFMIIAKKQMTDFSKTFTYYAYEYEGTLIPQGVDIISFYKPNLNGFIEYANNALKNDYCFHVDDMIIGNFLQQNGIVVEKIERKWKWPWKIDCFNSDKFKFSLFDKKGEYNRENSNKKCNKFLN